MTKTPIDPKDIRKGDLIRFEYARSDSASEYRVNCDREPWGSSGSGQHYLLDRPTPLPTEKGWYLTSTGEAVYLAADGYWTVPDKFGVTGEDMGKYAPFTRMEPVPVTAKQVLDAVRQKRGGFLGGGLSADIHAVAAEFGVSE